MPKPGYVRGKHFTKYVDKVKNLRRAGQEVEAEELLNELVLATEAESKVDHLGVAPWYYEQLAIIFAKRKDLPAEIAILERFARQDHALGATSAKLMRRLETKRQIASQDEL